PGWRERTSSALGDSHDLVASLSDGQIGQVVAVLYPGELVVSAGLASAHGVARSILYEPCLIIITCLQQRHRVVVTELDGGKPAANDPALLLQRHGVEAAALLYQRHLSADT